MMVHLWTRKAVFATLVTVCLLGISWVSFADINFVKLTLATAWNLTQRGAVVSLVWFPDKSNLMTVEEDSADQDTESPEFLNLTQNWSSETQKGVLSERLGSLKGVSPNLTRSLLITADNSSQTVTTEVISTTTTMTFNNSVVVRCKESPYIECVPPELKPVNNKIFKITFLRRPPFMPDYSLNLTTCKINQCVIGKDGDTDDADLVVIYGVELLDNYGIPQRKPGQLFGLLLWESPVHTYSGFIRNGRSPWNNQINLIMTYRLDVDVPLPYNKLMFNPKPLDQRPNYYDIAQRKTRTALWLVSNCLTPSKRHEYVQQMKKYIDIDIFGACGTRCNSGVDCENWVTRYKFYLAFENSLCTDYVTEKFFKLFNQTIHVIPVVRGGADYDKHFPNFTYINSAHFKTPKDLALYLRDLASDLETYSKYLEHKDLYTLVPYRFAACKICTFLHTHQLPNTSQIHNLTSSLGVHHCHGPTDLS